MTVKEAIQIEIDKSRKRLEVLQIALEKADDGSTCRTCTKCLTKNLNYYADSGHWTCAYCG
jgi:hypothetical protein